MIARGWGRSEQGSDCLRGTGSPFGVVKHFEMSRDDGSTNTEQTECHSTTIQGFRMINFVM